MFKTIVVPLDGSPLAERALPLAIAVAKKTKAALHLAIVHLVDFRGPQFELETGRAEQSYIDQTAARVRESSGLTVTANVIEEGPVALGLCGYGTAVHADLIVLTTHGRGPMSRFWLGSVTDQLLRTATIPVLVHRPAPDAPPALDAEFRPRRILVPLDGSATAAVALAPAAELARLFEAGLRLLRVVEPIPFMATTADDSLIDMVATQANTELVQIANGLRHQDLNVDAKIVLNQPAAMSILGAAEWADLIILASHGRGRMARLLLGSVADKVVRGASCPVLVVRSPVPIEGRS